MSVKELTAAYDTCQPLTAKAVSLSLPFPEGEERDDTRVDDSAPGKDIPNLASLQEVILMAEKVTQATLEARRQAERALLGAILLEGSVIDSPCIQEVRPLLKVEDFLDSRFSDNLHARIFKAIKTTKDRPNEIGVAEEMNKEGTLRTGDCAYLCSLIADCPSSLDWPYYVKAVLSYAGRQVKTQYRGLRVEPTNNHGENRGI
ncbi:MAG TPA: DnaB-like helicase N-terminal domain-containing protein [Dehalococcoidia bacterium]